MSEHDHRRPKALEAPETAPAEQKPQFDVSNSFMADLIPSVPEIGGNLLDRILPDVPEFELPELDDLIPDLPMPEFDLPELDDLIPDLPIPEIPLPSFDWPSLPIPELPKLPKIPMPSFDWPWERKSDECDSGDKGTSTPKRKKTAFDQLVDGGVARGEAPKTVELPDVVDKGMQKAWDGSMPGGNSQEQGGILVQNDDGSYEWKAGAPGKSGSFKLNTGDVEKGETLVGSGHTHPYGKNDGSLDGATGVAFSGGDLANMVDQKGNVKFVQSGDERFMVSKTKEWDAMVAAADTPEKKAQLTKDMKALWNKSFSEGKGTFQENCDAAALAVSNQYHLNYYRGEGKTMNLQNPKKDEGEK